MLHSPVSAVRWSRSECVRARASGHWRIGHDMLRIAQRSGRAFVTAKYSGYFTIKTTLQRGERSGVLERVHFGGQKFRIAYSYRSHNHHLNRRVSWLLRSPFRLNLRMRCSSRTRLGDSDSISSNISFERRALAHMFRSAAPRRSRSHFSLSATCAVRSTIEWKTFRYECS